MCKVLSALSVGSDSALLRSGWDALNLAQLEEPMWKPSTRRALQLKPLLIARTLLSGILITSVFYSKKVCGAINKKAISLPYSLEGPEHAMTLSLPSPNLMTECRRKSLQLTLNFSQSLPSTSGSSRITTRPELSLADSGIFSPSSF